MQVLNAPKFGKITVTAARHYQHDGSDEYFIRLSGPDRRLAPIRSMGDKFTLRVHSNGAMKVEYDVEKSRILTKAKMNVKKDEIAPLLKRMAEGSTPADWQRLLGAEGGPTPLLRATFPAVTFENSNGDSFYERFPHALQSTFETLGLSESDRPLPLYRRVLKSLGF